MQLLVRTAELPASDRFLFWHDTVRASLMPYTVRAEDPEGFHAEIHTLDCGYLRLHRLSHQSIDAQRSARHIRQSDPESIHLASNLRGLVRIEQMGRIAELNAGDLVLYDSSHPFHSQTSDDGQLASGITVGFPRTGLPLRERLTRQALMRKIDGGRGTGRILGQFLQDLARHGDDHDLAGLSRLGIIALDMIAAAVAGQTENPDEVLLERICAFIRGHLGDADLGPNAIAVAYSISTRTLYRIFRPTGTTVGAWIREQRLERCRRDLADPALRAESVASVGARWGFKDAAHFSRAFRAVHGRSPASIRGPAATPEA